MMGLVYSKRCVSCGASTSDISATACICGREFPRNDPESLRAENASLRESVAAKDGEIAIQNELYGRLFMDAMRSQAEVIALTQQLAAIQLYSKGLREALDFCALQGVKVTESNKAMAALSAPAPDLANTEKKGE